jgi:hypothetical protein
MKFADGLFVRLDEFFFFFKIIFFFVLCCKGQVEVRLAGKNSWGTICGDGWSLREAVVSEKTCKNL